MSNAKRKRKDRGSNRILVIVVTVVLISVALVLGVRMKSLEKKKEQYMAREQELIAQVAAEEERAQTLEEYRVYVQTKQYIEKVAKEKLGLVNPDEILLKPNE